MLASKNKNKSTGNVHFASSKVVKSGESRPQPKPKVKWYWKLFNWVQRLFS